MFKLLSTIAGVALVCLTMAMVMHAQEGAGQLGVAAPAVEATEAAEAHSLVTHIAGVGSIYKLELDGKEYLINHKGDMLLHKKPVKEVASEFTPEERAMLKQAVEDECAKSAESLTRYGLLRRKLGE